MFETLYTKTFAILFSQLFITWAVTTSVIRYVTRLYKAKVPGVTAKTTKNGKLDLEIDMNVIAPYFYGLLVVDIIVFLLLLFIGKHNLIVGLPLFSVWSIITGIMLGLALISYDENLGGIVLSLTVTIAAGCALFGIYSGIDFGSIGIFLFGALILLLIGNIIRLFVAMPTDVIAWFCGEAHHRCTRAQVM